MFDSSRKLTPAAQLEYPLGHPPERMALGSVNAPDPRVIHFERMEWGALISVENLTTGAVGPLDQTYVRHSPTGLEFGYGGSGPADTALNVLSLVVSPREAFRLHQHFKPAIAGIPREGGKLALEDVRAWIAEHYAGELADTDRMHDEKEMAELLAAIDEETRAAEAAG